MPKTHPAAVLGRTEAERLAQALCDCYETFDAPDGLFAPDVFLDSFPPQWRFQLQGRSALLSQLRAVNEGATITARLLRVVPTATGFVMETKRPTRATRPRRPGTWTCARYATAGSWTS